MGNILLALCPLVARARTRSFHVVQLSLKLATLLPQPPSTRMTDMFHHTALLCGCLFETVPHCVDWTSLVLKRASACWL